MTNKWLMGIKHNKCHVINFGFCLLYVIYQILYAIYYVIVQFSAIELQNKFWVMKAHRIELYHTILFGNQIKVLFISIENLVDNFRQVIYCIFTGHYLLYLEAVLIQQDHFIKFLSEMALVQCSKSQGAYLSEAGILDL